MTLHIAPWFTLPTESVAQTFGILATKGAGKSNAAVVMAEEMWSAGIPWVAIDPKGDWFGMRSSADGKKPGLALPVFGGLHGDVPLHADGGVLLADLIIDERLTCVVDVSDFSKGEQTRFLVDLADRLFRRQRRSPEPMHLFLEEAHEYLPQRVMRDQAVLVGLWSRIVKQGRSFGLGVTVISQRSASLNKDVLTQIGTLIVLRTLSPQDRKAIKDWVDEYDVDATMLKSLPSLEDGEAWIWSPQFLKVFEKIRFRQRRTFDSGATPKLGQVRVPKTLADIDLSSIEKKWAASIERAKETDPRELQKRVRELERKLSDQSAEVLVRTETVYAPVPDELLQRVIDIEGELRTVKSDLNGKLIDLGSAATKLGATIIKLKDLGEGNGVVRSVSSTRKDEVPYAPTSHRIREAPTPPGDSSLPTMQRKILTVLAQHGPRTVEQLLLQTGYRKGGAWNTALSRLRSSGFITVTNPIEISGKGTTALGQYESLPTGPQLLTYWKNDLGQMCSRIIDALLSGIGPMSIDGLLYITDYKVGGAWNTALSRLRKLNIIEGNPISLTDEFKEAIR